MSGVIISIQLTVSLIRAKYPFFPLLINFTLKSIFSDIRIVIPSCFVVPLVGILCFQLFTQRRALSLKVTWVLHRQKQEFCFLIHSTNLCLLIGELRPFKFKAIIKRCGLLFSKCIFKCALRILHIMYFDYILPSYPKYFYIKLPHFPTQICVLFFFLLKAKLCCQNTLECVAFQWGMVNLSGTTVLQKMDPSFPRR